MGRLFATVQRFLRDESGPTAVEYAVMLALIIVVCIAAITTLGNNASYTFNNVALNGAVGSSRRRFASEKDARGRMWCPPRLFSVCNGSVFFKGCLR